MKTLVMSLICLIGYYSIFSPVKAEFNGEMNAEMFSIDTLKDTVNPYNFHLHIVLRKKHYHALLTVKDTMDKILLTKEIDSLRVGRNFFNIPTKKKLPPIVKWEIKAGDFQKKGKMAIH